MVEPRGPRRPSGPRSRTVQDLRRLLPVSAIAFGQCASDRVEAVRQAGELLADTGAVHRGYVASMLDAEASCSSYSGEGVAVPHGTYESRRLIRRDALSFVTFEPAVDWDGVATVTVVIGVAAKDGGHADVLGELGSILLDPLRAERLRSVRSVSEVRRLMRPRLVAEAVRPVEPVR